MAAIFNRDNSAHRTPDGTPCPHLRTLISALSDGSLTGLARWYAAQHAKGCSRCANALVALRAQRDRLRALGLPSPEAAAPAPPVLSPERREALEAAWRRLDETG